MDTGTPGSRIDCWRTKSRCATLLQVGDHQVPTVQDVQEAFAKSIHTHPLCPLLFAYLEIRQDISHNGLPIMHSGNFSQATHDQLNNCWDFLTLAPRLQGPCPYDIEETGEVLNYVTHVMHLTQGKLLKQQDWHNWQDSEFLQLDQYFTQGMFGDPCAVTSDEAVFNLVWTYSIKALDGRKKGKIYL
jgi:hypothetical protein